MGIFLFLKKYLYSVVFSTKSESEQVREPESLGENIKVGWPAMSTFCRQIDRQIYIYRRAVENIVTFISFFLSMRSIQNIHSYREKFQHDIEMRYLMISLPGRNSTGDEVPSLPFTRRKGPHNLTLNKKNNKIKKKEEILILS